MNIPKCPACSNQMTRHGKTKAGRQRWRCKSCSITNLNPINTDAKNLELFLSWLLSGKTLKDTPGQGRTFQRRTRFLWDIWPLPPIVDEVHPVVYVDGIHLGRKAVVLIARSDQHVLGWYVARNENSRAWKALLNRIAPLDLVVCDGGSGFMKACKTTWPDTKIQRCVFHVFTQIKTATTTRPKLEPNWELYQLGKRLLHVKTLDNATQVA